jgi:hypothetical protein
MQLWLDLCKISVYGLVSFAFSEIAKYAGVFILRHVFAYDFLVLHIYKR